MMSRTSKISPVHWGVLLVGFPLAVISAVAWTFNGYQALRMPENHSTFNSAQTLRLLTWTITGEHLRDGADLTAARVWLAIFAVSLIGSIVIALAESRRLAAEDRRGSQLVDKRHMLMDIPFWQVGDRGAWVERGVRIGTIVEAHRRPFQFQGQTVEAFAGGPGLVLKDDKTGEFFTRPNGMLFRLAGTSGPSGTLESIHDEMNAAVSVGDGTSWIDPKGEVQEGTILEIKHEPFEVRGRRVDASADRPGYVIARIPDGEHVGVSDKLREGV